jgi:hypothetical protein
MFNVTHNAAEVIDRLNRFTKQGREATARALTMTARDLREALPKAMEADLDKPTPFTLRGFYLKAATSSSLQAEVGIMPKQAAYLKYQVLGGSRSPNKVALRLPAVVSVNQYGNLPAGVIKQLIARAKAGKRTTKRQSKRSGVSSGVDLFYGDPGDGRPPGIYKRVVLSATRHQLVPVVVMPKRAASYRRRFDFFGHSRRVVLDRWSPNVSAALARALAES